MLSLVNPVRSRALPLIPHQPVQVLLSQRRPVQMRPDVQISPQQQVQHPLPRRLGPIVLGRRRHGFPSEPRERLGQAPQVQVLQVVLADFSSASNIARCPESASAASVDSGPSACNSGGSRNTARIVLDFRYGYMS